MSNIKSALGPWSLGEVISSAEARQYISGDGQLVEINRDGHGGLAIVVWRMEDDERSPQCEAHAYAAAAAPELLEALRHLRNVCKSMEAEAENFRPTEDMYQQALSAADAAIDKATGVRS